MSVLLIGVEGDLAEELIPLMVGQGDEVRIVENEDDRGERWKELGAYIAHGDETDPDLVMRAATGCRTIVASGPAASGGRLAAVVEGAVMAGVERVVVCPPDLPGSDRDLLQGAEIQYVALGAGRRGLLARRPVPVSGLATAIDAADDLGGEPHLELDLRDAEAWEALGLEPPS